MKNNIRLIGIDMDGTLLNSLQEVSKENRRVLKMASDAGICTVIATGRVYSSARLFARYTGIQTPIIACNGAIIKDGETEEVLYSETLPLHDVEVCIRLALAWDVYYHVFSENTLFSQRMEYSAQSYRKLNDSLAEKDQIHIEVLPTPEQILERSAGKVLKVVIADEDLHKLAEIRTILQANDHLEISSSWYNNIEIMKKGVNKGTALEKVALLLGVAKSEVMALGDSENDLSMLQFAGTAVVMGNALPAVKAVADFVTLSNDENGVAHALLQYLQI